MSGYTEPAGKAGKNEVPFLCFQRLGEMFCESALCPCWQSRKKSLKLPRKLLHHFSRHWEKWGQCFLHLCVKKELKLKYFPSHLCQVETTCTGTKSQTRRRISDNHVVWKCRQSRRESHTRPGLCNQASLKATRHSDGDKSPVWVFVFQSVSLSELSATSLLLHFLQTQQFHFLSAQVNPVSRKSFS